MIPNLQIKYSLDKEVEKFFNFLHHPKFPQHRNLIFNVFPNLQKLLEQNFDNKNKEMEIIKKFISEFREKHEDKIKAIVEEADNLLRKDSQKALKILAILMDYNWDENHPGYIIMPTILPFSPFEKNIFYFSILGEIKNKKNYHNIIFVTVHEISHMILLDILQNKYKKGINEIMGQSSWYFFKEIIAPVIMNQNQFKEIIYTKNYYFGNPFLCHIFVLQNNKKIQITKFFQEIYEKIKNEQKKNFSEILETMVNIILSIEIEIENKHKIWNKFGDNIVNLEKELSLYSSPIKVNVEL